MAFLSCPDFGIKYVQCTVKLAFHGTDTNILADILARIVSRMSACRSACHRNNFVSYVLAGILARISELMLVSAQWNSTLIKLQIHCKGTMAHGVNYSLKTFKLSQNYAVIFYRSHCFLLVISGDNVTDLHPFHTLGLHLQLSVKSSAVVLHLKLLTHRRLTVFH